VRTGVVRSAHDCSEGGLLVAAAEMAIGGNLGLHVDLMVLPQAGELTVTEQCFAETPSRYLLEIRRRDLGALDEALRDVPYAIIGEFREDPMLTLAGTETEIDVAELKDAWTGTLDWS
jgi:phosphoribosylformylglycinamidine synthase